MWTPPPRTRAANIVATTIVLLASVYAAPGHAQPPLFLGRGPGNVALNIAILNGARNALDAQVSAALEAAMARSGHAAAPAAAAPPVALTYEPDARLTDWTRLSMIETLSQGNSEVRARLQESFAGNAVLEDFDSYMSHRGYSSHNVADDMAEMLLVSWQIATDGKATDSQARGVHAQTQSAFVNNAALRTLTPADRQLMAERIAYRVILSSSAREEFLRNGDRDQRAQLKESSATMLREQGIDAAKVHLTDEGFRE